MLDPAFKKLVDKARKDPDSAKKYAAKARKMFKLSPYWDGLLHYVLTHKNFAANIPFTGGIVDSKIDEIDGKQYYSIPVYPETTDANIRSSAKLIRSRYKERGEEVDIRNADVDKTLAEFRALELSEEGKAATQIVKIIDDEFEQSYITNEIAGMIRSAKEKSLRQENVS
jgi:hypothetical protein